MSCDDGLTVEYLTALKKGYEEWLQDVEGRIPVLRLDWNTYMDTKEVLSKVEEVFKTKSKGLVM